MSTAIDATNRLRVLFTFLVIFTLCNVSASQWQSKSPQPAESSIGRRSNAKMDANIGEENEDDDEESARNFVSPHEQPREVPVKVRINGDLATPPPDSGIDLGFVPKQTYYQVRRYDTKVHLPRSAAVEEADTAEELLNAPRLREVVSHKKTQQVYEEQGYEDAAYDHGGYKKGGEKYENKNLPPPSSAADADYASDTNRRARIDNQSQEQTHIVKSTRLENATDSDDNENDHSVESGPKRKNKDETTNPDTSGEEDSVDDGDDHDHRQRHNQQTAVADSAVSRYRPKTRANVRSRFKNNKNGDDAESKSQTKSPHSVAYVKRRRKINDSETDNDHGSDSKTAQESKSVRSKLKVTTRRVRPDSSYSKNTDTGKAAASFESDFVTPTTYRPSTLPERLTMRLKTSAKRKPSSLQTSEDHSQPAPPISSSIANSFAKNTLVDSSGYVFENPFAAHLRNSHDAKPAYPLLKWKGAASTTAYAVNERPLEYNQTPLPLRSYDKASASATAIISEAKSKYLRNKNKPKTFPYEIVNAKYEPMTTVAAVAPTRPAINDDDIITAAKWRKKAMASADAKFKKLKTDFPYEIITAASSGQDSDAKRPPEKWIRWPRKRPKHARFKNISSPFGTADDSPWIPITPKEAYDIHGYSARRKNSMASSGSNQIQVTENESATSSVTENSLFGNKRRKMNPIRVMEQDNSEPSKGSRSLARTVSTSYSIRHEYDATPVNWIDKPTHRFEGWWTTASPPPQINQSFDSQRKLFEDTLRTRSPSPSPSTVTTMATSARTASSREWTDDSKDIETLSSNRYTVFQPYEYTTSSLTPSSRQTNDKPLLNRHPYLPRETWHLQPDTTANPQQKTFTSTRGNEEATSTAATAVRDHTVSKNTNENKRLDKIIVYPASTVASSDYALSAASFVQNLTLAHYADPSNSVRASLPPNYRDRLNTLTDHLVNKAATGEEGPRRKIRSASGTNQQLLNVYMDGSTTEIAVDLRKYPFYKSVSEIGHGSSARSRNAENPLAKYSVLRYISNPNLVPTKTAGQMSFYQSRNRIECPEPDAPQNVIPERERDGDWVGDGAARGRGEPRVRNVGRSILCHKIKFFGSDPLDNPFFKEDSVGFPLIFPSSPPKGKSKSKSKRAAIIDGSGTDAKDLNVESVTKKSARKVHLAGGFINARDYNAVPKETKVDVATSTENSSSATVEGTSTTIKTIPLTNELEITIPYSDSSTAATVSSFIKVDDQIRNNSVYQKFSNDFRITNDKSKKKVYAEIDAIDRVALKPQYKEPSWRNKKRQQGTTEAAEITTKASLTNVIETDNRAASNSQVDSLLYVIHPESGRGKWMKILKVEQLPGANSSTDARATAKKKLPSEGIKFRPKQTLREPFIANSAKSDAATSATDDRFGSNEHFGRHNRDSCGFGFGFSRHSPEITQQTETRRANIPLPAPQATHQTYHISGLLRQVAPLKASQVEINNLQTTAAEENLEQVDGDEDESGISPSSQSIQPRYKHRDHVQYPQPHERLYYYVVDE